MKEVGLRLVARVRCLDEAEEVDLRIVARLRSLARLCSLTRLRALDPNDLRLRSKEDNREISAVPGFSSSAGVGVEAACEETPEMGETAPSTSTRIEMTWPSTDKGISMGSLQILLIKTLTQP